MVHPRQVKDLVLAPVAIGIDANLQALRDKDVGEVYFELALEQGATSRAVSRDGREQMVQEAALRFVDLRGWQVNLSRDATRLHLSDGAYAIDLALSPSITTFIEEGAGQLATS